MRVPPQSNDASWDRFCSSGLPLKNWYLREVHREVWEGGVADGGERLIYSHTNDAYVITRLIIYALQPQLTRAG
jgi:hypothetical protein